MIAEWTVGNFKSIGQPVTLDLAPLTIICGANSSGKSTLLQSMLVVAQTFGTASKSRGLILNGQFTRLGEFTDLLHMGNPKGRNGKMNLRFALTLPAHEDRLVEQILLDATILAATQRKMNTEQELPVVEEYELVAKLDPHETIKDSYAVLQLVRNPQPEHPGFDYKIRNLVNFERERSSIWELQYVQAALGGLVPTGMLREYNLTVQRADEDLERFISIVLFPKYESLPEDVRNRQIYLRIWALIERIINQRVTYVEHLIKLRRDRDNLTWGKLANYFSQQSRVEFDKRGNPHERKIWKSSDREDFARRLAGFRREWLEGIKPEGSSILHQELPNLPSSPIP